VNTSQILQATGHRPWPRPSGPWIMRQTWNELLFAHWPVPPAALAGRIPAGLTLDTFDGQAWVGVVPFHMTGVRVRGLPPIPTTARLAEINLRTYVVAEGKPGVWFFSLDASSPLAVVAARAVFFLPYFNARFAIRRRGATVEYASRRTHRHAPPGEFAASYRPLGPIFQAQPGTLEDWLTARYCLYSANRSGRLFRGEIHHVPWPLQVAEAEIARNTLASGQGIAPPDIPPLLHYAHRIDMVCWPLQRVPAR
jgi:uncharacterized protein